MKLTKLKKENGITLVALVVTIVVLLILAGITITMLFSDNGIIKKAQEASNKTTQDQANTEEGLSNLEDSMLSALGEAPKLNKKGELVPVKTKYATYTDDTGSAPIPGGYCVVNDYTRDGILEENKVGTGLVISDLANDTLSNDEIDGNRGNQFVWVPVNDEQLKNMYGTDSFGKKWGKLYDFTSTGKTKRNWTGDDETTKFISITSKSGSREPDVLTSTTNGDASTAGINLLKNVVGINVTGEGATEKENILKNWTDELQKNFDDMIKSVERYKGFYIGRYETGSWSAVDKNNVPKVSKKQIVALEGVNWYYQYQEIRNLKANENVTTNIIWGCQFDRTLEWIAQTNLKDGQPNYSLLTDSSSWGNYENYKEVTNDHSTESGILQLSGTNEAWNKNHIYDLAGNAWDWTMESILDSCHSLRGGACDQLGSDRSAFIRLNNASTASNVSLPRSSRSTLLINP